MTFHNEIQSGEHRGAAQGQPDPGEASKTEDPKTSRSRERAQDLNSRSIYNDIPGPRSSVPTSPSHKLQAQWLGLAARSQYGLVMNSFSGSYAINLIVLREPIGCLSPSPIQS